MRTPYTEHVRPAALRTLAVTCICLSIAIGGAVGAIAVDTPADADVSYESTLDHQQNGTTYRWYSTPLRLSVSVDDIAPSSAVCLGYRRTFQDDTRRVACHNASVGENGTADFRFERREWPGSSPGTYVLVVSVGPSDAPDERRRVFVDRVVVLDKAGDVDEDGLRNIVEYRGPTNLTNPDTDGDGLRDGAERTIYNTSPVDADTDGDGLRDGVEVMFGTDPNGQANDSHSLFASSDSRMGEDQGDGMPDNQVEPAASWPIASLPVPFWYAVAAVLVALAFRNQFVFLRKALTSGVGTLRGSDSGRDDSTVSSPDWMNQNLPPEEEYVLELLRRQRGTVQQGDIVEESSWSKAKVSRVVSQLEAKGWIEKRQEGRRNVIVLEDGS